MQVVAGWAKSASHSPPRNEFCHGNEAVVVGYLRRKSETVGFLNAAKWISRNHPQCLGVLACFFLLGLALVRSLFLGRLVRPPAESDSLRLGTSGSSHQDAGLLPSCGKSVMLHNSSKHATASWLFHAQTLRRFRDTSSACRESLSVG